MFKRLTLVNFMPFADAAIDFDAVCSITGQSDHGKTCILRALKLIVNNENFPEDLIRDDQQKAVLELTLSNGAIIRRERTRRDQRTVVTKPDGSVIPFTGKQDASPLIQELTGIHKVTLDPVVGPEDAAFVTIYEPFYGINLRPDTLMRRITAILGAGDLEIARIELTREKNQLQNKQATATDKLKDSEDVVTKAESEYQAFAKYEDRVNEHKKRVNSLAVLQQQVIEAGRYNEKLQSVEDKKSNLSAKIKEIGRLEDSKTALTILVMLVGKLSNDPTPKLKTISAKIKKAETLSGNCQALERLNQLLVGGVCETCGRPY